MPRLIVLAVGLIGIVSPWEAAAKPMKVAVAHLEGDYGNKVGRAVGDALDGKQFTVIGHREVTKAIEKLHLSEDLDAKQMKELQAKLGAAAVVSGKVEKDGSKRTLHLKVFVNGKKSPGVSIQFANTKSPGFRTKVHEAVAKKLSDGDDDDDDKPKKDKAKKRDADDEPVADKKKDKKKRVADADDEPKKKTKKRDDDDTDTKSKKKKVADADDEPKPKKKAADADDEPKSKKKKSDDDEPKKKRVAEDDDDSGKRKSKSRGDGDEDELSVRASGSAPAFPGLRVDLGASYGQRHLSYVSSMTAMAPPTVSTAAPSGRISGEVYPLALSNPKSPLAGLGFTGEYEKVMGLSIQVPGMSTKADVDQHHYSVGARYQFAIAGSAAVAVGIAYARRAYLIDRSGATLDAPDVNYKAARPEAAIRVPVSPTFAAFGGGGALLILSAGSIADGTNYGSADAFGFEAYGGIDYKFTDRIGLRVAGELSQISLTFKGTGNMAMQRGVSAASDRTLDLVAALGMTY